MDKAPKQTLEYAINIKKPTKTLELNLNISVDQLEKIILSKFIVDENVKQNVSIIRIDGRQPNQKEKDQSLAKLKNKNVSLALDELFDALLPENMLEDLRIQNFYILPEIPYIFLKLNKTTPNVVEFDNQKYFLKIPKSFEERKSINNNLKYVNELNIPNMQSIKGKVYVPNVGYGYLLDHMEGETLDKINLMKISFNDKIMILYRILEVFQSLEKHREFYIELKIENVLVHKVGKQIDVLFINYDIMESEKQSEKSFSNVQNVTPNEPKHYHFAIGTIAYFLFHSKISPSNLIDNLSKNVEENNNKANTKLQVIENFIFNVLKYDSSISINMEDLKLYLVANNARMFNHKFNEKSLGLVKNENTVSMQKSKKIDFKVEKFEQVQQEDNKMQADVNTIKALNFANDPSKLTVKKELATDFQTKNWINSLFAAYYNVKDELTIAYVMKGGKSIALYDVKTYKQTRKFVTQHTEEITCVKHHQDKIANVDYLITSSYDKSLRIFSSINDYDCIVNLKNCHYCYGIYSFVITKNDKGTYIVSCNSFGQEKLKVWDFTNGSYQREFGDPDNNLYLDSWNYKDEDYMVSCNEYSVKIHNFNSGEQFRVFKAEPVDVHLFAVVYEFEGKYFLYESANNGYIRIWNIIDNVMDRKIFLKGCKFSSILKWNQKYLIVSSKKVFNIIDVEKKSLSKSIYAHEDWLGTLAKVSIPLIGECLVSSSIDGKIKMWA